MMNTWRCQFPDDTCHPRVWNTYDPCPQCGRTYSDAVYDGLAVYKDLPREAYFEYEASRRENCRNGEEERRKWEECRKSEEERRKREKEQRDAERKERLRGLRNKALEKVLSITGTRERGERGGSARPHRAEYRRI
jgi:hypothetical protein